MNVTSEFYESFNEAKDNEWFDTGDTSNDTRENLAKLSRS
ncbi:2161_t:CDS:2 [Entrophospora sp. SA101]|nr:2161_t:CDS:2 [Entrophospora sp. SA101]